MSISYSEYYNLRLRDFDTKKKEVRQIIKQYEDLVKEAQQPGSRLKPSAMQAKVQEYKDKLIALDRIEKERKLEVRKQNRGF